MPDRRLRVWNARRGTGDCCCTHHSPRNQPWVSTSSKSREGEATEHIVCWHNRGLAIFQIKMEQLRESDQTGGNRQGPPTIGMLWRPASQRFHQKCWGHSCRNGRRRGIHCHEKVSCERREHNGSKGDPTQYETRLRWANMCLWSQIKGTGQRLQVCTRVCRVWRQSGLHWSHT